MPIDKKYGRVTLEHGSIPADEPVVVFRARDSLLPKLLMYYRLFCAKEGSRRFHLDLVDDRREEIEAWQKLNAAAVPQSKGYELRHGA